jgi:hypothetical protein
MNILEIEIEVLVIKEANDSLAEEERYHAPPLLRPEKDEENPITARDIVSSLHEYLKAHKHDIVEEIDETAVDVVDADGKAYPDFDSSQPLFFAYLFGGYQCGDGQHNIAVCLFWENDLGITLEDFWTRRGGLVPQLPGDGLMADSQLSEAVAALEI